MFIKQITSCYGRDIYGIFRCEACNKEQKMGAGYDDDNYHNNVVPKIKCNSCNESRESFLAKTIKPD